MKRRFSERFVLIALVTLLGGEVLLLLLHLGIFSFLRPLPRDGEVEAGVIVQAHNQLRRRGVNSLVWDQLSNEESVFFHDSVLTLAQSTAVLKLHQQSEVALSENTLVTIEPLDQYSHGEIRLKFVKGSVSARNPYQRTQIDGQSWSVDVQSGSELALRQVDGQNVEIEMVKGLAVVTSAKGSTALDQTQIVRMQGAEVVKLEKDHELRWKTTLPARTYSHLQQTPMRLEWQGEAQEIIMQTLGKSEIRWPISGQRALVTELNYGQHRLYLRAGGRTSDALEIQVWKAPVIHLLRPLPRDRESLMESVNFMWMRSPEVHSYVLKVDGDGDRLAEDNSQTVRFSEPGDRQWSVEGRDREGFAIPPLYKYELFIRKDPLAPPVLKAPRLRAPATKTQEELGPGAWLWHWLIPQAQADERELEAVFEWESVAGADQYIVEISRTPDFRNPVLMRTLRRPYFVWRGFEPETYYWRVAAGLASGSRMGRFSEPAAVELKAGSPSVRWVARPPVSPTLVERDPPKVSKSEPEPVQERHEPQPPTSTETSAPARKVSAVEAQGRLLGWRPQYLWSAWTASDGVKARLNGVVGANVIAEFPTSWHGRPAKVDLLYGQTKFQPSPPEKYPFQAPLVWRQARMRATTFNGNFGYGGVARNQNAVERESLESLRLRQGFAVGGVAMWVSESYQASFEGHLGSLGLGFASEHELRWRLGGGVVLGVGVEANVHWRSPSFSTGLTGFTVLGYEF